MKMQTRSTEIAGLRTTVVAPEFAVDTLVVLLHGYSMTAADLSPFAVSLGIPAIFLFPEGFRQAQSTGRAWFPMDIEARRAAGGAPRDLFDRCPEGLIQARERMYSFVRESIGIYQARQVILGGFSQGGMLCCDLILNCTVNVHGLMLWSASRLNYQEWVRQRERLRDLRVLVSHGERDPELAFAAGTALRDFLRDSGAAVTWVPFEGGHEIPLVVWRAVRSFLRDLSRA